MENYQRLLRRILDEGVCKEDRTGTGTISLFGVQLRFNLSGGKFPLLTTKRVWFKGVAAELLWMLRGKTNIRPLVEQGVSIWTDWALQRWAEETGVRLPKDENGRYQTEDSRYEDEKERFEAKVLEDDAFGNPGEFAKARGELGPVYGKQWRAFEGRHETADQIAELIQKLNKNPDSRRLLVSAWNPAEVKDMALPPCHYAFECWTRELRPFDRSYLAAEQGVLKGGVKLGGDHEAMYGEKLDELGFPRRALSLKWTQRSVDSFLGLPFNIASYGLLTHILADQVNMVPGELIASLGDCHIYLNHLDQVEELLSREPRRLPHLNITRTPARVEDYRLEDFEVVDYNPHPSIKAPIAV